MTQRQCVIGSMSGFSPRKKKRKKNLPREKKGMIPTYKCKKSDKTETKMVTLNVAHNQDHVFSRHRDRCIRYSLSGSGLLPSFLA